MKLINIECNKYLIFPLIGGFSGFIVNIIVHFFNDNIELKNHPFIIGINAGFGMSLSFFPYLCFEKCNKKQKKKKLIAKKNIDEICKEDNPETKGSKYIIIFLCAFLDFIQKDLVFLFRNSINKTIWMFNIVFLIIFSSIIFQKTIYKHQYLCIGIMVILGTVFNFIDVKEMKLRDLPALFLSIFIEIIFSLEIVLAKYALEYYSCSPFEITFYNGFFSLILNIIILITTTNIPLPKNFKYQTLFQISEHQGEKYLDNFYLYTDKIDFIEILLFVVITFGRFLCNLFSIFTLKYYSTSHILLVLILCGISLDWFNKSTLDTILIVLILLFEFLVILIYCEIIELNFCGLQIYTKKNIQERKSKFGDDDEDEDNDEDNVDNKNTKEIWNGLELSSDDINSDNSRF